MRCKEGICLRSNSARFIFCEHFLEHIDYPVSANRFISECYRILKKNGKLVIGVPDSEQVIQAYINKEAGYLNTMCERWKRKRDCNINSYMEMVNYHFREMENHTEYSRHFWSYDIESLFKLLQSNGFEKIRPWDISHSIINAKRLERTIYIEGIKK